MKKDTRAQHEFSFLSKQYSRLKQQAAETKASKLWRLEALIRSRIRELRALQENKLPGYKPLFDNYTALFEEVSRRLLESYNAANSTDYVFEEVIKGSFQSYLRSGIISVLVTNHIPKIVAEEFSSILPDNPKDEYPAARRMKRRFILHLGDTNTGKTYNALQRLKECQNGIYLAPLRILALENFEYLNRENVPCSLLTGEEEIIVENARHSSCTVEKADLSRFYGVAVIDEIQLLSDSQRGDAWTRAILGLCCEEIHLCGAINVKNQLIKMLDDCGDDYEIKTYSRPVPLQIQRKAVSFTDIQPGDAYVAFSKRRVLALSSHFADCGIACSVIYGNLPPEVRRLQYEQFSSGKSRVLVSTDAIGMGVNLPIRRIIFTDTEKFDGEDFRPLSSQEIKQIAGRAGRLGIYNIGYVAGMSCDIDFIDSALQTDDPEIEQAVVGPSEELLKITRLPLKEKIALWSTREEKLGYYRKKDVRDFILILDRLKPYKLEEADQWRLMMLPFDVNNESLLLQFLEYVEECFILKAEELSRPVLEAHGLSIYEEYYQKINLYYSFSKAMNMRFDAKWVEQARARVCEDINELLK
ncbi:MAG: helicase-related protein [Oscillospiraceae bacterium]|nr:RNA helicase [Oscillospiraceae bacterium]